MRERCSYDIERIINNTLSLNTKSCVEKIEQEYLIVITDTEVNDWGNCFNFIDKAFVYKSVHEAKEAFEKYCDYYAVDVFKWEDGKTVKMTDKEKEIFSNEEEIEDVLDVEEVAHHVIDSVEIKDGELHGIATQIKNPEVENVPESK